MSSSPATPKPKPLTIQDIQLLTCLRRQRGWVAKYELVMGVSKATGSDRFTLISALDRLAKAKPAFVEKAAKTHPSTSRPSTAFMINEYGRNRLKEHETHSRLVRKVKIRPVAPFEKEAASGS